VRFYYIDMSSVTWWPDGKGAEESKMDKRHPEVTNDTAAALVSTHRETCPDVHAGPTALP